MGIKDLTEKILEDYNDIFVDIVNVTGIQRKTAHKAGDTCKYRCAFPV